MMPTVQWLQHWWVLPVTVVFSLILLTTYWPGRGADIERKGRIPLHLEEHEGASRRAD